MFHKKTQFAKYAKVQYDTVLDASRSSSEYMMITMVVPKLLMVRRRAERAPFGVYDPLVQNLRNVMDDGFGSQEELRSHECRLEVPGRDPADRTFVEAGSCTKSCGTVHINDSRGEDSWCSHCTVTDGGGILICCLP